MTRYQKYMQHIHDQATAGSIEQAVMWLTEDIAEFLIKSGVKADSKLIEDVRNFKNYEYQQHAKLLHYGNKSGITKL